MLTARHGQHEVDITQGKIMKMIMSSNTNTGGHENGNNLNYRM